jgi:hypothetical protein
MFEHLLDASLFLRQIVANVYTRNPYLHTCNPNLLTSSLFLPTPPPSLLPPPPPPLLAISTAAVFAAVCPRRCPAATTAYRLGVAHFSMLKALKVLIFSYSLFCVLILIPP